MPTRRAPNTMNASSRRRRARLDASADARRERARGTDRATRRRRRDDRAARDATTERRDRRPNASTPISFDGAKMARGERAPLLARGEDVERGLGDDDAANGEARATREGREGRRRRWTTALALGGCAALASAAALAMTAGTGSKATIAASGASLGERFAANRAQMVARRRQARARANRKRAANERRVKAEREEKVNEVLMTLAKEKPEDAKTMVENAIERWEAKRAAQAEASLGEDERAPNRRAARRHERREHARRRTTKARRAHVSEARMGAGAETVVESLSRRDAAVRAKGEEKIRQVEDESDDLITEISSSVVKRVEKIKAAAEAEGSEEARDAARAEAEKFVQAANERIKRIEEKTATRVSMIKDLTVKHMSDDGRNAYLAQVGQSEVVNMGESETNDADSADEQDDDEQDDDENDDLVDDLLAVGDAGEQEQEDADSDSPGTETGNDGEDEANEAAEEQEEEDHEINELSNVELLQLLDDKLDDLEQSNEDFKSAITEQIEGLSTRMSNLEDSSEELQDDVTEMALDEHYDDADDEHGDSYPRDGTGNGDYPTGNGNYPAESNGNYPAESNGNYPAESNGNYPAAQTVTVDENALSTGALNDQISSLTTQLQNATATAAQATATQEQLDQTQAELAAVQAQLNARYFDLDFFRRRPVGLEPDFQTTDPAAESGAFYACDVQNQCMTGATLLTRNNKLLGMKGVCDNGAKSTDLTSGYYEMFPKHGTIDFSSTDADNECTMEFGENSRSVWIRKENDYVIAMSKDGTAHTRCGRDVASASSIKYQCQNPKACITGYHIKNQYGNFDGDASTRTEEDLAISVVDFVCSDGSFAVDPVSLRPDYGQIRVEPEFTIGLANTPRTDGSVRRTVTPYLRLKTNTVVSDSFLLAVRVRDVTALTEQEKHGWCTQQHVQAHLNAPHTCKDGSKLCAKPAFLFNPGGSEYELKFGEQTFDLLDAQAHESARIVIENEDQANVDRVKNFPMPANEEFFMFGHHYEVCVAAIERSRFKTKITDPSTGAVTDSFYNRHLDGSAHLVGLATTGELSVTMEGGPRHFNIVAPAAPTTADLQNLQCYNNDCAISGGVAPVVSAQSQVSTQPQPSPSPSPNDDVATLAKEPTQQAAKTHVTSVLEARKALEARLRGAH